MVTQLGQTYAGDDVDGNVQNSKVIITAVSIGLLLGMLLTLLLSGLNGLNLLAIWVLSMGMTWIGVAIASQRIYKQAQWGMVMAGQAMGALAILLLIFSTM